MVQIIITAFRAKHKFNLSNERLKTFAEKWSTKIENEEDVNTFIDNLDVDALIELAKMDDANRKPTTTAPEPTKDDETKPNTELEALKSQLAELSQAVLEKNRTDLSALRAKELVDIPNELKTALKHVKLDSLSDDEFTTLKTELKTQADLFELKQSQTNPRVGGVVPEGKLSASEENYLKSKQKTK